MRIGGKPEERSRMRIGRRYMAALALAAAGALALAGIALADGDSTAKFEFTPDEVPKATYAKGSLFVHTHTNYTGGTRTDRAQLFFDDDLRINARGIPRCDPGRIQGQITMEQAMVRCGTARVGSGRAEANAALPGDAKACVLVFNGMPSAGRPTLLLFTRAQVTGNISCADPATNTSGNTTVLLEGLLRGASGDFGTQLDIQRIASAALLPLSDFKVTVRRGNYVSARCNDRDRTWNLRARFTYVQPTSSQTVTSSQRCRVALAPPNTRITKTKVNQRRKKASFRFRATGRATGFECRLNRQGRKAKPFRNCRSPKTYKRLKRARYTFQVRAVGPGGKDPSPARKSFRIKRR
jgi:hypothetical protein